MIISVGFTVYGVHGVVPPATLPASTSSDASSSATANDPLLLSYLPLNLLSKLSNSSNSAPPPSTHCLTPSVLLPRYCGTSPGQPRAIQANPLTTASQTFPLCPTSQDFETSWDLLLISFLRMRKSTHHHNQERSIGSLVPVVVVTVYF